MYSLMKRRVTGEGNFPNTSKGSHMANKTLTIQADGTTGREKTKGAKRLLPRP